MYLSLTQGSFIYLYFSKNYTLYTCSAYLLPLLNAYISSFVFPAANAVIRFHMTTRRAFQKSIRTWYIRLVTCMAAVVTSSVSLAMFITVYWYQEAFGPIVQSCQSSATLVKVDYTASTLINLVGLATMISGILYDFAMYHFIKNRKKSVQPKVAIVSWGNHHLKAQVRGLFHFGTFFFCANHATSPLFSGFKGLLKFLYSDQGHLFGSGQPFYY